MAPTILVEPEKVEEAAAEGEAPAEELLKVLKMPIKQKKVKIKQPNLLMIKQKLLQLIKGNLENLPKIKQKLLLLIKEKPEVKKLKKNNIG